MMKRPMQLQKPRNLTCLLYCVAEIRVRFLCHLLEIRIEIRDKQNYLPKKTYTLFFIRTTL